MTTDKYELLNREQKKELKTKRVAAYCRVSTDNEDQANSFESQRKYFKRYIEYHEEWELYEIFADEGISGTNTKKRREFNRMIDLAKKGYFDLIITKEISRFARNILDSILYTRELKKYGVGVIFMNDNINTLDGDSELRLAIMSSIAQEESRKTSERVKWGQKRRMEEGVVFGRSMLGYDVKNGKMYINKEGAKIVRLIFYKFVTENKGTHVIARELLEENVKPSRGNEWSSSVILKILRNEKYCGDLVQKKTFTPDYLSHERKYNRGEEEFIIIRDHHEPIVSRDEFDAANRILDKRAESQEGKSKFSARYLFSGKIKCGRCGKSYVARYKKRKDGSIYKSWRCVEASKYGSMRQRGDGTALGCSNPSVRGDDVMRIMRIIIKNLKYDKSKIINLLTKGISSVIPNEAQNSDARLVQERLTRLGKDQLNLLDLYINGVVSQNEYETARERIETDIRNLKTHIDGESRLIKMNGEPKRQFDEIIKIINELVQGVEYEDEFYRYLLDKMIVTELGEIEVYLNFISEKWSFSISKTPAPESDGNNSVSLTPTSVNIPAASL